MILDTIGEKGKEYVVPLETDILEKIRKEILKKLKEKPKVNSDGTFTISFDKK